MSTPVRRALYGKMAGDTTLTAMLATGATGYSKAIYEDSAPEGAAFPFVVFSKSSGVPTEAFGDPSAFENDIWLVKAVDRNTSSDPAEAIQARIVALLNDSSLSISGATLCYLRRQSDVEYSEVTDGVKYKHRGALFRLVTTD
jgi:hypothetical protein